MSIKTQLLIAISTILSVFSTSPARSEPYNVKIISNESGLSNSAVLSMYQDHQGYMWLGTCDGLNVYDGKNIQTYKPSSIATSLSGNLIEGVIETHDNVFWIQTNYGLNRLNRTTGELKQFNNFQEKNYLLKTSDNHFYLFHKDNIYYYVPSLKGLKKGKLKNKYDEKILNACIDSNNNLWIFKEEGTDTYLITRNGEFEAEFKLENKFDHKTKLLFCKNENDVVYFVDQKFDFYEYDIGTNEKQYITNLETEIRTRGEVTAIVKHNKNYLVGFKTSGVIQIEPSTNGLNYITTRELNIKTGVFCILSDKNQDIIWVGTDGQGVFMYSSAPYTAKSFTFNSFHHRISKPIRAVFIDKKQNLWIGTKGDGILKIVDYSRNFDLSNSKITRFSSSNCPLKDNSVYAFEKSHKDLLWIGHEEGLNYYSYKEEKIKDLTLTFNNKPVRYIHSICELNDSTLWLASVGEGLYKVELKSGLDPPQVKKIRRITLDDGAFSANNFFSHFKENDSIIWFGNRGQGACKVNTNTMQIKSLKFGDINNNKTLNDVFSIKIDQENILWLGTSFGLIKVSEGNHQIFNENHGFPNNTIHSILAGSDNSLWLSTNQGIVRFDRKLETLQTYNQNNGLEIIEFSDGAYFKHDETGDLFFGGINGLVRITENFNMLREDYIPKILFRELSIFGKNYNINDFLSKEMNTIRLNYKQNFFSIRLTAIDFLNSNNYNYMYKLEGLHDNWIENGPSSNINFTNIPPGNYILRTRFQNPTNNLRSEISSINISIAPPWYQTTLAYFLYFTVYVLLVFLTFWMIRRWYRLKNKVLKIKMQENKKVELFESKLQFFTNITHELFTPLTLIQGPCEKLLSNPGADERTLKYSTLIKRNADKLYKLIQELIDFRKIETDHKSVHIHTLEISDLTTEIATSFLDLAESQHINYQINIQKSITWNSDSGCISKIFSNLLSNAFKYTETSGTIEVKLYTKSDTLIFEVLNTGPGISETDIPKIFDRYKILDEFGMQDSTLKSRNGLGLAICHSMTSLLKGKIDVESKLNKCTKFTVTLPKISEIDTLQLKTDNQSISEDLSIHPESQEKENLLLHKTPDLSKTLLIIDDDEDMLKFIEDLFIDTYTVISCISPLQALELLEINSVDLIITDVMMAEINGIELTKKIKQNRLLSNIPIILLSAQGSTEYQVNGIESGAEIYLTKPFSVEYLVGIAHRFLQRNEDLKDYYNSIFSVISLNNGKVIQQEDKDFLIKILEIIEKHISNPELSVEKISEMIGYSRRNLYRKLNLITDESLVDIIKQYRFKLAEKLILSTNMTIDEIILETGFHNRGNFYKSFKEKYAMTPKDYRSLHRNKLKETT